MFLMWIVPLLLVGAIVYAVSGNRFANLFQSAVGRVCPQCSQPAQADWKNCPHCGQAL